jgi:hypothetical protein
MSAIKCPKCKGVLETNATICEWCGFVINKQGSDSIENITQRLSDLLVIGKKLPKQGLFSSLSNNAKISMPVFAVVSFILAYKINGLFLIPGLIFTLYALVSIFKKRNNISLEVQKLQAEFDSEIQRIQNLYGGNNSIAKQIQEYKNEWKSIRKSTSKSVITEWISYIFIATLFLFAVGLPTPKTSTETKQEQIQNEELFVQEATNAIKSDKLNDAIQLLSKIKSTENTTRVKSMIQLKKCKDELDRAENNLNSQNFEIAKDILEKTKWEKISVDYDAELIEETFFKQFVQQKNNLIKNMPEEFQISLEDEYGF